MIKKLVFKTKDLNILIVEEDGFIVKIDFLEQDFLDPEFKKSIEYNDQSPLLKEAKLQIENYLLGKSKKLDFPIRFHGTKFQMSIWEEIRKVEYGERISYKELANRSGFSNAYRATGSAAGKNPLPLIIPCHRIVKSDGSNGGFAYDEGIKRFLLDLENNK